MELRSFSFIFLAEGAKQFSPAAIKDPELESFIKVSTYSHKKLIFHILYIY